MKNEHKGAKLFLILGIAQITHKIHHDPKLQDKLRKAHKTFEEQKKVEEESASD